MLGLDLAGGYGHTTERQSLALRIWRCIFPLVEFPSAAPERPENATPSTSE